MQKNDCKLTYQKFWSNKFSQIHGKTIIGAFVENNELFIVHDLIDKKDVDEQLSSDYNLNTQEDFYGLSKYDMFVDKIVSTNTYFPYFYSWYYYEKKLVLCFEDVEESIGWIYIADFNKHKLEKIDTNKDIVCVLLCEKTNKMNLLLKNIYNPYGRVYKENFDEECEERNLELFELDFTE